MVPPKMTSLTYTASLISYSMKSHRIQRQYRKQIHQMTRSKKWDFSTGRRDQNKNVLKSPIVLTSNFEKELFFVTAPNDLTYMVHANITWDQTSKMPQYASSQLRHLSTSELWKIQLSQNTFYKFSIKKQKQYNPPPPPSILRQNP